MEEILNLLLDKFNEYLSIVNYRMEYMFEDISERFQNFNKDNILSISYTDAIIDFDASKIGSKLKASYILFEEKRQGYQHLCIAQDMEGKKYAESFFYNSTDLYIRNQSIVKIKSVNIYDKKNQLYLEDIFL